MADNFFKNIDSYLGASYDLINKYGDFLLEHSKKAYIYRMKLLIMFESFRYYFKPFKSSREMIKNTNKIDKETIFIIIPYLILPVFLRKIFFKIFKKYVSRIKKN